MINRIRESWCKMANRILGKMSPNTKRYWILLGIVAAFLIIFSFTINNFASIMTVTNLVRQSAVFTILSVGMTLIIIVGGIDLSVGANIALSGAISALVMNSIGPDSVLGAVIGILVSLFVSMMIGAVNGFLCGYLGISAFIVTLGMQAFCKGLTLMVTKSARIVVSNRFYKWFGSAEWKIFGIIIPAVTIILILLIIFSIWSMKNLKYGVKLYAVGGNPSAAFASGINVKKTIFTTHVLNGLLCGLATVITIGRASSAQPLAGEGLEFTVITAVVLGGTSLLGGVGTLGGTFLGCLLMGTITLGINMVSIPVYWNYIIEGVCVLVAVLADQLVVSARTLFNFTYRKGNIIDHRKMSGQLNASDHHILELKGIDKSFSGVPALKNVSFRIEGGKVHGLVGENGAGKSTLIKILSGVYHKDAGAIFLDGEPVEINTTMDSKNLGISVIYQEFALIPELTVTQNTFLGKERKKFNLFLAKNEMERETEKLMEKLNIQLNVKRKVKALSVSRQQMVEIAKAMGSNSWLMVMDEPTSAITDADREELFKVIREMKAGGMSIVYISHRLQEVLEICDDVTVLRDGELIATVPIDNTNEQELTKMMVGREISDVFSREKGFFDPEAEPTLLVENLYREGVFEPISFSVRPGEVLGLSGLMGAGRTEIARCIFGMDHYDGGNIYLNGLKIRVNSPHEALSNGICYVSEDRRREGIIPLRSVKENISLADMELTETGGKLDHDKADELYKTYKNKFRIKSTSSEQPIVRLSGGNQQKCCVAKMLACDPKLLILDEPTRGIDVGAKKEIHQLIEQMARDNMAVILISSELPEIMGACDRILVLSAGRLSGEFSAENVTEENIMSRAFASHLDVKNE